MGRKKKNRSFTEQPPQAATEAQDSPQPPIPYQPIPGRVHNRQAVYYPLDRYSARPQPDSPQDTPDPYNQFTYHDQQGSYTIDKMGNTIRQEQSGINGEGGGFTPQGGIGSESDTPPL